MKKKLTLEAQELEKKKIEIEWHENYRLQNDLELNENGEVVDMNTIRTEEVVQSRYELEKQR